MKGGHAPGQSHFLQQLFGVGTVKANPQVCPWIGFIRFIERHDIGFNQKALPLLQFIGPAADLIFPFSL